MQRPKTIREAIHGDIRLEPHELDVINTRVFQRLHGIKQLGMAYLVYPTATHTRFEHALGCVHVAQRIIEQLRSLGSEITTTAEQLQQDPGEQGFPIPADLRDKIRMAALLHDLAHIPYGHTLENELDLLKERHDSPEERVLRFFHRLKEEIEADPTKDRDRLTPLIDYSLKTIRTISYMDKEIRRDATPQDQDALPPCECCVADIVGNTICADLLDYARRDMRATGLNQEYDDRLFSYFDLAPDKEGRIRLALRTIKPQGLRLDAVSEVLHVLRIRYTLSERVLFHHAKNIASAMLGEALSYLEFRAHALDEFRDEQLFPWLRTQASEQGLSPEAFDAVQRLMHGLESRGLHKAVFRVGPAQQASYEVEKARHLGSAFAHPKERKALQEEICTVIPQLRPGDVIIYCPAPQMTMKEVWANVLARNDGICRPLRQEEAPHLPQVVLDEIKALEDKYKALWSWTIVLAPEMLNYAFAIQAFIQQKLHASNDPFLQSYLERQDELRAGREIMKRAAGDYAVQAKAVDMALAEPEEMIKAAAAGPPAEDDYWDNLVRRARSELYPPAKDAP